MKTRINQPPKNRIQLGPPYLTKDELRAVTRVIKSGQLSLGKETERFEQELARYVGAKFAVATSSGTTALHLAVVASGIKDGDEVITSPFSFVASTNCFLYERAKPVFVDIDPKTFNLDVNKIEAKIAKKTKAILGVDIFGYPAEWQAIRKIARKYHLAIIEDAAEALGAKYQKKKLGCLGHPTIFAFYPNKQITTGEGGMITTSDEKFYYRVKSLVNQGRGEDMNWLRHPNLGYNYRMTEMAAAIGRTQLRKIELFLANRRQVASWYKKRLKLIRGVELVQADDSQHQRSWFIYVIRLEPRFNRDRVIEKLRQVGIPTKAYLPSIHLQPYLRHFGYRQGDFPVSEAVSDSTLALPFYTGMEEKTVAKVCEKLKKILK